jgi:hypothetical protein
MPVNARTMDRLLKRIGFVRVAEEGAIPTVGPLRRPHHKGSDLSVPLIRAILADVQLSPEQFLHRLES